MSFTLRNLTFELEGQATTASAYILAASGGEGYELLLRERPLDGQGFMAAVKRERDLEIESLLQAQVVERTSMSIANCETWLYTYAGFSADGVASRLFLAMLKSAERLVLLTSAGPAAAYLQQREFFEQVLSGVKATPVAHSGLS